MREAAGSSAAGLGTDFGALKKPSFTTLRGSTGQYGDPAVGRQWGPHSMPTSHPLTVQLLTFQLPSMMPLPGASSRKPAAWTMPACCRDAAAGLPASSGAKLPALTQHFVENERAPHPVLGFSGDAFA